MRPVNLIPAEQRRGEQAPLRTGPLAYIVLGALVLVLAGVIALVLTGNQISERKDEVVKLKREDAAAAGPGAAARRLHPVPQPQRTAGRDRDQPRRQPLRLGTGDARTRADPAQRRLAGRTSTRPPRPGSASAAAGRARRTRAARRLAGPALEHERLRRRPGRGGRIRHRAEGHRRGHPGRGAVLRTRQQGRRGGWSAAVAATDCRTREFIAKFSLVVAFDAAPVPAPEAAKRGAAPTASAGSGPGGLRRDLGKLRRRGGRLMKLQGKNRRTA